MFDKRPIGNNEGLTKVQEEPRALPIHRHWIFRVFFIEGDMCCHKTSGVSVPK